MFLYPAAVTSQHILFAPVLKSGEEKSALKPKEMVRLKPGQRVGSLDLAVIDLPWPLCGSGAATQLH